MARFLAVALLLLAPALWQRPAAASSDDSCDPTWMLTHRERTGCDDMPILQPGNDTRTTLLLLTLDRRGKPITPPPANGTPDPFAEWPTFAERFTSQPADTERTNDEYAYGEGSRCLTNKPGAAAFTEQVKAATEIPESERTTLIAARDGLAPDCTAAAPTGGAAIAKALEPVQSPLGKSFAAYLMGAQAFYDGDYDAAKKHFSGLTGVKQPWLAETARYMLARVEVNRAQIDAFDEYGNRKGDPADPKVIDAAEAGFKEYLSAYPQGAYAASARGLLRRVYWLGGRTKPLADAYVASLTADTPDPGGMDDIALLDEIDNKLLMPSDVAAASDPILLAVDDLTRMRDGSTFRRADIEAQRPSFASNTPLFEYLLAAHDLYVGNKPDAVLAAIPAVAPKAPLSHVEFSRQMLRGMALEAQKDPGAREHWMALLPAAVQPLQRPAVELALALHDEQAGKLDAVFAADSPISNASMREILLRKIADADLLRRQAKDTTLPQHERDVALYVLLYKEVTRGKYADFVKDVELVRADAPAESFYGDLGTTETPPLGVFTQTTTLGDYGCGPLKETAAQLAKNPTAPKAQLCLADFMRANGFDNNMLDWQPKEPQLGSTPSRFKGEPYARFEVYKALIANPKTPPDDRAYALYRAVNCYAPAQSNSCGGEDVPQKQRKAWFQELKKRYPKSTWAKELQLYW
ncbi:outer membrane assembly lipoprotein YfiO [Candidatus Binatia bacterium]|nr:outer membrane assembly lipoprotein YfiO [Candidatus Binatia bacterium]